MGIKYLHMHVKVKFWNISNTLTGYVNPALLFPLSVKYIYVLLEYVVL